MHEDNHEVSIRADCIQRGPEAPKRCALCTPVQQHTPLASTVLTGAGKVYRHARQSKAQQQTASGLDRCLFAW